MQGGALWPFVLGLLGGGRNSGQGQLGSGHGHDGLRDWVVAERFKVGPNEFGDGLEATELTHGVSIFLVEGQFHQGRDGGSGLMVQVATVD